MSRLGVILFFVSIAFTLSSNSMKPDDCISAEQQCKNDSLCNNTYLVWKGCSSGDRAHLLTEPECLKAAELISKSPISFCKCTHHMKNEEHCLNIYWTVHPFHISDYLASYDSPYAELEPKKETKKTFSSEPHSHNAAFDACLNATNTCGLNKKCSQLRNDYVLYCSSTNFQVSCDQQKCRGHLRNFIKKIPMELTKNLLICPCSHTFCGERRRQNIVPKCSFEESNKKNCLQLRDSCMTNNLCRSRFLDYRKQCFLFGENLLCSPLQYDKCIKSYIRMIGTEITPNFISNSSTDISLWCTCEGSGNELGECDTFLGLFTSNRCFQEAVNSDFTQSLPMTVNPDNDRNNNKEHIAEEIQEQRSSSTASGVSAPSYSLLAPALFMWLLEVVLFM
ncbi:hypothetical protein GDO78_006101 [Eleutherodactylus coqui]|uniref:GDNF/GAS1 domain-containing protein n=1 Tax=Eleutherodactylus coqui TaxID=57060 RepID=A0A8J6FPX6_ELECQ|nr:hypothetical protein GDO78_006101 [Eleutherodactylus coqui]KAG9490590.1 hypothetical protein GDO78_006101 [Eleutherodactylus coqui]